MEMVRTQLMDPYKFKVDYTLFTRGYSGWRSHHAISFTLNFSAN